MYTVLLWKRMEIMIAKGKFFKIFTSSATVFKLVQPSYAHKLATTAKAIILMIELKGCICGLRN